MKELILVADIGGTNSRFALFNENSLSITNELVFQNDSYSNFAEVLSTYLKTQNISIDKACLAVASPIIGDQVTLTNRNFSFSIQHIKQTFNFQTLFVINDFTAVSMAIPLLKPEDLVSFGDANVQKHAPCAIYGAGTGLGVAHLLNVQNKWISLPGEGGHVNFAPTSIKELQVLEVLLKKHKRVSAERVLSGAGIENIYHALCEINNKSTQFSTAKQIVDNALQNKCETCTETLNLFCEILGAFGGNLALNIGAFGGVYIAGGIAPRFIQFLKDSHFYQKFLDKGRFEEYLKQVPLFVVTRENPGLLGAGNYLINA